MQGYSFYALEYAVLPAIAAPYFRLYVGFTWCGALFNGSIVTAICALLAFYRSHRLSRGITNKFQQRGRLEPVWPAMVALLLAIFAALQLIGSVSHLSYYRDGPLVHDIFE